MVPVQLVPVGAPQSHEEQVRVSSRVEKKTCRTYQNTVSRMKSERLCLTKEEWRKFEDQQ